MDKKDNGVAFRFKKNDRVGEAEAESDDGFKFLLVLVNALYTVGAVGLKPDAASPEYWSYFSDHVPSDGTIKPTSILKLHPVFWRAVGARPTA